MDGIVFFTTAENWNDFLSGKTENLERIRPNDLRKFNTETLAKIQAMKMAEKPEKEKEKASSITCERSADERCSVCDASFQRGRTSCDNGHLSGNKYAI